MEAGGLGLNMITRSKYPNGDAQWAVFVLRCSGRICSGGVSVRGMSPEIVTGALGTEEVAYKLIQALEKGPNAAVGGRRTPGRPWTWGWSRRARCGRQQGVASWSLLLKEC